MPSTMRDHMKHPVCPGKQDSCCEDNHMSNITITAAAAHTVTAMIRSIAFVKSSSILHHEEGPVTKDKASRVIRTAIQSRDAEEES